MFKSTLLLGTILFLIGTVHTLVPVHQADWTKADIAKLTDSQKQVDTYVRSTIKAIKGNLVGFATLDSQVRLAYKTDDKTNWDVQVSNVKDQREILRATKTENQQSKQDPNLIISKKTALIKKGLKDIVGIEI